MAKHAGDAKSRMGADLDNTDWLIHRFSMLSSSKWFLFQGSTDVK